jgi:hypothetical protein
MLKSLRDSEPSLETGSYPLHVSVWLLVTSGLANCSFSSRVALVCQVDILRTFLRYNSAEWTEICNRSSRINPGREALSIACLKDPNTRDWLITSTHLFRAEKPLKMLLHTLVAEGEGRDSVEN